jgi:nitroreductase
MGTRGFSDNFPAIVVVVGRQRAYANHRDRHIIYIDGSLAAMSFIYALETMGLSSCAINWPDMEPQESAMTRLLGLEPDERVIMLIAVGYADPEGLIPYSQKLGLDRVRSYNRAV